MKTTDLVYRGDTINTTQFQIGGQTGWICPKCGKVHAPWVPECDCHKSSAYTTTTGTGGE